jgi:kynurenine formamidase
MAATIRTAELLKDPPKNWGRWGPDDEVGALNFLTSQEVLRGVQTVRQGKVFTLQVVMGHPQGDPVWPGRSGAHRINVMDHGYFLGGKGAETPGEAQYSDDMMIMYLQGSTQYDALGHVWCEDQLWNGYHARTTIGSMTKASVLPLAERGIVGRGILVDMAHHRGKESLERGETFTHLDLVEAARQQRTEIEKRDILIVRTGWIGEFYKQPHQEFYRDYIEPGLTYTPELIDWFREMEIPNLVTDIIANEVSLDPDSGVALPLHTALMRNLGVTFTEIAQLDPLAADCAEDGQWTFLYVAAPLKVYGGTGSPVNPIVVK